MRSGLFDPAALLIRLPIGGIETLRLGLAPALPRGGNRIRIIAVEQQDHALVSRRIDGERRPIDQKTNLGAVGIVVRRW